MLTPALEPFPRVGAGLGQPPLHGAPPSPGMGPSPAARRPGKERGGGCRAVPEGWTTTMGMAP